MYIIYEYAACIVVALIATTLPFAVFAICLLLKSGIEWALQTLTQSNGSALSDSLSRRTLGKALQPTAVPVVYRRAGRT